MASSSPFLAGKPERRDLLVLGAILFAALGLRLSFLLPLAVEPGFEWPDPDHYLMAAKILARDGFTFRVVRYEWAGREFFLPPLYPVFLSLFSVFSDMELAAQLGQAVLGVAAVGLVFELGRLFHSVKAGLLAALVYALWFPNVITHWFYQEVLYVPILLLAFVLYLRASRFAAHCASGLVFGLAALTRSMPLYYLPPLLAVHVAASRARGGIRSGVAEAAAIALGFALATAPYSIALSKHLGEVTVIENHGGIILLSEDPLAGDREDLETTAESVLRGIALYPSRGYESLRSILHLNGGRILETHIVARDETEALLWKLAAHLFSDLTFAASLVLAPFGLLAARRREGAVLFALWIALNVVLVTLGGFAGPRLRGPFEPHLIVLASIALLGGLPPLRRKATAVAVAASVAMAAIVAPQVPRTARAWPDYAIRWQHRPKGWRALVRGSAGFNVIARSDPAPISLEIRARDGASRTVVTIRLGRRAAGEEVLGPREVRTFGFTWPHDTMAFVELRVHSDATGKPSEVLVVTPRPR